MKYFFLTLLLVISWSCSKNSMFDSEGFDKYGLSKFDKNDFTVIRHYTLIGPYVEKHITPLLRIRSDKHYTITWDLSTSEGITGLQNTITHDRNGVLHNAPSLPESYVPEAGDIFTANINIDGKIISRAQAVIEIKKESDIFMLKFGMDKSEVEKIEIQKFKYHKNSDHQRLEHLNDRFSIIWDSYSLNFTIMPTITIYHFTDNKLDQVGEFCYEPFSVKQNLLDYCSSLGLKDEVKFTPNGYLAEDYSWYNGRMRFILMEQFDLPFGYDETGKQSFTGVYYRLLD